MSRKRSVAVGAKWRPDGPASHAPFGRVLTCSRSEPRPFSALGFHHVSDELIEPCLQLEGTHCRLSVTAQRWWTFGNPADGHSLDP